MRWTSWPLILAGAVVGGAVGWVTPPWVGAVLFLAGVASWIAVRRMRR